ncbi:hypothetical protein BDZ97DRAFT_1759274 [Flammula alnicola]|nr:hypothetical protein BDZ97DRAFT_1759274 [Flammula alnicola]
MRLSTQYGPKNRVRPTPTPDKPTVVAYGPGVKGDVERGSEEVDERLRHPKVDERFERFREVVVVRRRGNGRPKECDKPIRRDWRNRIQTIRRGRMHSTLCRGIVLGIPSVESMGAGNLRREEPRRASEEAFPVVSGAIGPLHQGRHNTWRLRVPIPPPLGDLETEGPA